jgi:hypothetical protein
MAVNPIKVWNGTAWEYTGPVVAAPPVKYQATAPTSPATGDVWVESDYDVASVDPSKLLTGGVYTNESTRSAAIPTPTTGMVTYVGDTGTDPSTIPQVQAYNGTAWQEPYGLSLVASTTFTGANTHQINNVFTTAYKDYLVILQISSTNSTSQGVQMQLCSGGTPNATGAYYSSVDYRNWNTGATSYFATSTGTFAYFPATTASHGGCEVTVGSPVVAENTRFTGTGTGDVESMYGGGLFLGTTSFDGIKFAFSTSTLTTGRVTIYGYRNS